MSDKQKAIDTITIFLKDKSKRILLIRGYDNDIKLAVALSCLNQQFSKGIIRTSSMSDISFHINRAFNKNLLPSKVKSTTTYKLGSMSVKINSYTTRTKSNPTGTENTFTLYYPVQTVLDDPKRYNKFLSDLLDSHSSKILLLTSNEWSIKNLDIEKHVDQVFFYDVENDNPEIMHNLRANGAVR
ncbi:hypothetical protein P5663_16260 [Priestia flexa]|uniref:hypothetical protein n=1 Tax=Priestia flexa TaxID=86664 RepID=UPI00240E71C0|nr:hypothetical protein [Priestia flexa]WEZ07572.1 hypothetical protein P5663_16260 [Priestia flexa]